MSEYYKDLTNTTYPDEIDEIEHVSDISADTYELANQYKALVATGKFEEASALLNEHPELSQCSINAEKWNQMADSLLAVEQYAKSKKLPIVVSETEPENNELIVGGFWIQKTDYLCVIKQLTADGYVDIYRNDGFNTTTDSSKIGRTGDVGEGSVSFGRGCSASGTCSQAFGESNIASGYDSHAEGNSNTASGVHSHAEGYSTTALDNQHAQGHFNNTTTAKDNSFSGTSNGTAFVIGNGTDNSSLSNAFRVTGNGVIYATNAAVQAGADYAEYFEWSDGNPNNEDRVGLFVTFDESEPEKIRLANNDDYILGIVSGMPSVIGNGDEDWKKRYVLDDFGRYIQETFEYEKEGKTKTGTKWKENLEYDSTKPYTPRDERAEWSAIGLVGVLSVYDDGTCKVNGYCKCKNNGIATVAEKGADTYRVIKRVTDNIVKVVLK